MVGEKSTVGIRNFISVAVKKFLGSKNTAGAFARPTLPMGAFVIADCNTLYFTLSSS
jgi:hypothetical protein